MTVKYISKKKQEQKYYLTTTLLKHIISRGDVVNSGKVSRFIISVEGL